MLNYFYFDDLPGFAWLYPKGEGGRLTNIGVCAVGDRDEVSQINTAWQRFVAHLKSEGLLDPGFDPAHAEGSSLYLHQAEGRVRTNHDTCFIIGDAAAVAHRDFWNGITPSCLSGKLAAKHPPQVLVDCNGVAYELDVPMSTFYNLPAVGDAVTLHTHLVVREDAQTLYGFGTLEERAAFRQLLKISGIGARTALAVLSGMSVAELSQAVTLQEAARLTKVPGIGKKTAERLLLELKGKLADVRPAAAGAAGEVLDALLGLGYSEM